MACWESWLRCVAWLPSGDQRLISDASNTDVGSRRTQLGCHLDRGEAGGDGDCGGEQHVGGVVRVYIVLL